MPVGREGGRREDFPSAKAWVAFGAVVGLLYGILTGWILGQLRRGAPADTTHE